MSEQLAGILVRILLEGVREVSGHQYESLLGPAGLSRFAAQLPPADWTPAASTDELSRLFAGVHRMLGEDVTRLFLRNCGIGFVAAYTRLPLWTDFEARAAVVPPAERLAWYMRESTVLMARAGSPRHISEDATAYYSIADYCYVCAGIHGVRAPICALSEAVAKRLGERILGHTLRVAEVECVAQGAAHCKIAVYK